MRFGLRVMASGEDYARCAVAACQRAANGSGRGKGSGDAGNNLKWNVCFGVPPEALTSQSGPRQAAMFSSSESNDIYVGDSGIAGESNTIRIGYIGTQTTAFIAGISGKNSPNGVEVFVNGTGRLWDGSSLLRGDSSTRPSARPNKPAPRPGRNQTGAIGGRRMALATQIFGWFPSVASIQKWKAGAMATPGPEARRWRSSQKA